jgi:hypothetical protein
MNCGNCLFAGKGVVVLVNDICPTCAADYTREATEMEIAKQAAAAKPIKLTAGYSIPPPKPKAAPAPNKEATQPGVKMNRAEVLAYLKANGHTSKDKAITAIAASKVMGAGTASALAKAGEIQTEGVKRGATYWVEQ